VVAFLQVLVPQLLRVFEHRRLKVSVAALPACQRLVAVLRQQLQRPDLLHHMQRLRSGEGGAGGVSAVFLAEDYLDALLSAVYRKSQFPADFDFDAAEEAGPDELNEDVEVSGTETGEKACLYRIHCIVVLERLVRYCYCYCYCFCGFNCDRIPAMSSARLERVRKSPYSPAFRR
jgi:hypothetical protein